MTGARKDLLISLPKVTECLTMFVTRRDSIPKTGATTATTVADYKGNYLPRSTIADTRRNRLHLTPIDPMLMLVVDSASSLATVGL